MTPAEKHAKVQARVRWVKRQITIIGLLDNANALAAGCDSIERCTGIKPSFPDVDGDENVKLRKPRRARPIALVMTAGELRRMRGLLIARKRAA
jgi:hypothetical protein